VLLAMDTATQTASIALYDWQQEREPGADTGESRLLAEWTWLARRRQTQDLMATVQIMLRQLELTPADLTALAVTTGPGSFTGVRIAVSAVKGMGLGLAHPVASIGLPVLSVTAAPWLRAAQSAGAQVWANLQAGRGRFNWCVFNPSGSDPLWRPAAEDHQSGDVNELAAALGESAEPIWLVGEETIALRTAVVKLPHVTCIDAVSGMRRAGNLARLAARHLAHGQRDELGTLQPLYLRQP
jgi:tRNA threonylcarbamoyladenosine biosynthesis protein TsaB